MSRPIRSPLRWLASISAVLAGLELLAGPVRAQTVPVQQVEAFENPPTNTLYAPVNFNGSATGTDPTNFPGITFTAQAGGTATFSTHAFGVGQRFYGAASPAQPFVTSVFNQTATNFINSLNTQGILSPGQPLPSLSFTATAVRVSNHSYVADFGNATADENAIRRLDFVANRDDVVIAGGAVTGVGSFLNQNLIWSSRNTLAVRGDNPSSVFVPGSPPNTIISGKQRADVWFNDFASFATGNVSSSATALIGTATLNGQTNAAHNQVIRSLITTGADKSAVGTTTGPWTRDTTNNLSVTMGAGKLNHTESLSILNAGEQTPQTVTANTIPNVSTSNLKGWSFGTVPASGQQAVVFSAPNGIQQLTASLNWNVTQTTVASTIDTSDVGRIFSDLALELRPVTLSGGSFAIGAPTGALGLSSNATLDNLEHLFFTGATGGGNLPPGMYALLVTGDLARATVYGLSYSVIPVPEPIGGLLLLPLAALMLRRRRNRRMANGTCVRSH